VIRVGAHLVGTGLQGMGDAPPRTRTPQVMLATRLGQRQAASCGRVARRSLDGWVAVDTGRSAEAEILESLGVVPAIAALGVLPRPADDHLLGPVADLATVFA